jgi:superfamily II DNA or RNA helicase
MNLLIKTPIKAYVSGTEEEIANLAKFLSYTNTSIQFQYKKHMKNRWWQQRDLDSWQSRAKELKDELNQCLMFKEDGKPCVRPGSISYIEEKFGKISTTYDPQYLASFENPKPFPWAKKIPFELYPYQKESVESLINAKHGNVQLTTGAGKTACILTIARNLGLKTVVAVPSQSIFSEMLDRFEQHLGKGVVGALGDGKKRLGKKFTVAISKSLTNLKPGTKEFEDISSAQVLLVDESHLFGAASLDEVCHNLFAKVPYRMFFSGTQTRGDGTEKLLQSIIGKTVATLTTEDAVKGGFISNHEFRIMPVTTTAVGFDSSDALAMKRRHFLHNDNIAKFIANLANSVYKAKGEQTLVLVDEIEQIHKLIPLLQIPYACATGEKIKELGGMDAIEAVELFNRGIAKVLIGTAAISTGTNIFPVHHLANWQGGSSEIKCKQGAVGRAIRKLVGSGYEQKHVPKDRAIIWDFKVIGIDVMDRHLSERIEYYKDSGTEIKFL